LGVSAKGWDTCHLHAHEVCISFVKATRLIPHAVILPSKLHRCNFGEYFSALGGASVRLAPIYEFGLAFRAYLVSRATTVCGPQPVDANANVRYHQTNPQSAYTTTPNTVALHNIALRP
jgi:hypothetical protein